MRLDEFIQHFDSVKCIGENQYMAKCPCHNDLKASLAIAEKDNKILMYCFAGCSNSQILNKKGLTEKDLFNDERRNCMKQIEKEYIYTDEESRVLNKVIRYKPKEFRQAQYINGIWKYNMQNARHVPYNLPNIAKSDSIYWVEGEKDADNLNSLGLVATTTPGGSSGFNKYKDEYSKYFKNKTIYIIPDNDEPGKKYSQDVYKALSNVTNKIKILDLKDEVSYLDEKSDISDVLEIYGESKTLEILEKLTSKNNFFEFSGQALSKELLEDILEKLHIKVGYNEITKDIDITGLPKEYSSESAETILPIFIKELLKKYGIKGTKREIEDILIMIFDSHRYNPIIEMFKHNEWDKKERFDTLFDIMNITDDFEKILIKKWFWQTVSIAFNGYYGKPYGIAGVLTLQGPQNAGKTRFCRNIALKTEWFTEGATIDMKDKDKQILASKGWIVELRRSRCNFKKETS